MLQDVALGARSLSDYTHLVGRGLIEEIRELAEPLAGKRVLHVSATAFGGGVSEILYALSSAANNNGSAFAGLSVNTPFYNALTGNAMAFGRFGVIVPVLAAAGSLAAKKRAPATGGTMPTHGPLFVLLLIGTVLLVGALTYLPALALGPVVEHLMLFAAR